MPEDEESILATVLFFSWQHGRTAKEEFNFRIVFFKWNAIFAGRVLEISEYQIAVGVASLVNCVGE